MIASENEWNVVKATLISPDPGGREGDLRMASNDIKSLKESQSTRLVVVFFPAWVVEKWMKLVKTKLDTDMGNWTWIFSNFGNRKVSNLFF